MGYVKYTGAMRFSRWQLSGLSALVGYVCILLSGCNAEHENDNLAGRINAAQKDAFERAERKAYIQTTLGWQQNNPLQCHGPWRYPIYNCDHEKAGPVCGAGIDQKTQQDALLTCRHADFGIEGYNEVASDSNVEISTSLMEVRQGSADTHFATYYDYVVEKCQREYGGARLKQMLPGSKIECKDVALQTPKILNDEPLLWSVTVRFLEPRYNELQHPRCGRDLASGKMEENGGNDATDATCCHPAFGSTDKHKWPNGKTIRYSAPGLYYKALPGLAQGLPEQEIAAACMTCDGIPMESASEKFACLQEHADMLAEIEKDAHEDGHGIELISIKETQQLLVERMLLLDMLYAQQLTPAQQEKAMALSR